jgi:phosphoadenosine phosphosulfate reductase
MYNVIANKNFDLPYLRDVVGLKEKEVYLVQNDSVYGFVVNLTDERYDLLKANKNITIISPDIGFYNWVVKENNIPSRINRTCCSIFKEGKTVEWLKKNGYHNTNILLFLGMRNEESNNRSSYGDEWKNDKWEKDWNGILPIRKWSELDVWLYTLHNNITINPKYKKGYSRVGCAVACPFYTKSTWALDKYWYSSMYDRWQRILKDDFIRNAKWTRMNCTVGEYLKEWNGGAIRDKPNESVLLEFSKYQGIEKEIAEKYFDNYCEKCGKRILGRDLISANMKLNGRKSNIFFCKKHLKIHHNIKSEKEWKQLMLDFKNSGCNLF